jgi:hypothetical protein
MPFPEPYQSKFNNMSPEKFHHFGRVPLEKAINAIISRSFVWIRLACHVLHLKDRLHRRFEHIPQPLFRSLLRRRLMSQVAKTACGIRASMNARKKHLGLAESLTHLVMACHGNMNQ